MFPDVMIRLPAWTGRFLATCAATFPDDEARMRLVIALAQENVRQGTGGPFAAAVFDDGGRLAAPGVNLVTSLNCSVCHAEVVALVLAQKALGRYDLGDGGRERFELVTLAEPCAMCLGAIPWSGVARVVCGARDGDIRAAGFDEGDKPVDWQGRLRQRGIEARTDVLREEAAAVVRGYAAMGGIIYGPAAGTEK